MKKLLIVLTPFAVMATTANALTVLETESVWTGTFFTNTSTGPITYHFGESFQVPLSGDTIFDKGRLNARSLSGRSVTIGISAYNTGTSVISAPIATQTTNLIGNGLWQQINFDPANIALTPGGFYALFMSTTLNTVSFDVGSTPGTAYVPGRYLVGPNLPGTIQYFVSDDAAFRVEFVAVPEPASMIAIGSGIALFVRRRRRT